MAFCGIGPIPKGKRRGTMEQCLAAKQIRYYGLEKVDPKLLASIKKKSNTEKEAIKLQKLTLEAKEVLRKFADAKAVIAHPDKYTKRQVTKALNDKAKLIIRGSRLKKRIASQRQVIKNIQKDKKRLRR